MNRRDFLRFRFQEQTKVAELSCERLHMEYMSVNAALVCRAEAEAIAEEPFGWTGESSPVIDQLGWEELLSALRHELSAADVLRVSGVEWLLREPFGSSVRRLIAAVESSGVEIDLPVGLPPG